ncbi:MAG: M48 family metalloprotease [Polyangiaceae bacterium]
MTLERFEAIVARLEARQKKHPGYYQFQVLMLALFGFGVLFLGVGGAILGAVLFMIGLLLTARVFLLKTIKLFILVIAFLGGIVKALFVRIPEPEGLILTPGNSPKLFALLEAMRKDLGVKPFRYVLMNGEFNASVVEVPRWLMLGSKRFLVLGLPLMRALAPDEFRAVLAHELGHVSKKHAGFGPWIYRVRHSWSYLHEQLEERGGGAAVGWFINRYAPFFNAYTFVLGRAQEYEADASAAQLLGPGVMGRMLVRVQLRERQLAERFWKFLDETAKRQPEPPGDLHAVMDRVLAQPMGLEAQGWLREGLEEKTTCADTHPALKDRLEALKVVPEVPAELEVNAAQHYLEPERCQLLEHHLSERWKYGNLQAWSQRHRDFLAGGVRLQQLEQLAAARPLNDQEQLERSLLAEDHQSPEAAVELLRELLKQHPNHISGALELGRILLMRLDQEEGEEWVEKAMRLDPVASSLGSRLLIAWHAKHGRSREVDRLAQTAKASDDHSRAMFAERNQWNPGDVLQPPELPEEVMAELRAVAEHHPGVWAVAVVRKQTRYRSSTPYYLVVAQGVDGGLTPDVARVFKRHDLEGAVHVCGERDLRFPVAISVPGAVLKRTQ